MTRRRLLVSLLGIHAGSAWATALGSIAGGIPPAGVRDIYDGATPPLLLTYREERVYELAV